MTNKNVFLDDNNSEDFQTEQRRVRTSFTPEQLAVLEQVFTVNNYPDSCQREQISQQTGLCDSGSTGS